MSDGWRTTWRSYFSAGRNGITVAGAEAATGPAKTDAEARAADLVLRLWAMRRALPEAADPLGDVREAVTVLARMAPGGNPWAAITRRDPLEQVFHDLFRGMATTIVGGLLLTLCTKPRRTALIEAAAMERSELELRDCLSWWGEVVRTSTPQVRVHFERANESTHETAENGTVPDGEDDAGLARR